MSKNKSPYLGYTEEEVARMEAGYFTLRFGGDFMLEDNFYVFTKKEVSKLHKDTLRSLTKIVLDGNDKDRAYALELIAGLVIQPMRLH